MRFLLITFLIALSAGCASQPKIETPPVLISDYCLKDKILWFEHGETIDYLAAHEPEFVREFDKHNSKVEEFCPETK